MFYYLFLTFFVILEGARNGLLTIFIIHVQEQKYLLCSSVLFAIPRRFPFLTCTLSPGGSPLDRAHEVFGWGLCDSASGVASWEGAVQAVLATVSEGA